MPLAAVTFLLFLPEDLNHADGILLERAQELVDEAAEIITSEKCGKTPEEVRKRRKFAGQSQN